MNEPEHTLTTADIERAVSRGLIKAVLTCLLLVAVVFVVLGLISTGVVATLQAAPSGLEIGQENGTVMAEPNTVEELTRLIRAHEVKALDVYSDGRVALRPRKGVDIMFTLDPGVLKQLNAQHVDIRRVDAHRK